MKIGFFTDTYFPQINGVTYTIDSWKKELEKLGHEVYVYYPSAQGYYPRKREHEFSSIGFPLYKGYRIAFPLGITKKCSNLDIVHIQGTFTMAAAAWHASKKLRIPKIFTYHTPLEMYSFYFGKNIFSQNLVKLYSYWEKRLMNACDFITVDSNTIKRNLEKRGFENIETIPSGVDVKFLKPQKKEIFRKKHNISSKKVIGYCGRIGLEKNLDDLIKIAPFFDGEILIVGNGPAVDYYKNLARKFRNVKFLDFLKREELPYFYSALDIFVHPSKVETFGIVALESMACGTPVVGANALALKETIQNNKTGYLYESKNIPELLEKIQKAYKNRARLQKKCRVYAKEYSVEKFGKLYEGLL